MIFTKTTSLIQGYYKKKDQSLYLSTYIINKDQQEKYWLDVIKYQDWEFVEILSLSRLYFY